jgi:hypothetical protein
MARDPNTGLGPWGQFDFSFDGGEYTDAGKFSRAGGTQAEYQGMTPEQRAAYLALMQKWNGDLAPVKAFVASLRSGQTPTATPAQAPGPSDPYTQAAAQNVKTPWGWQETSFDPATGQWTTAQGPGAGLNEANNSLTGLFNANIAKGLGTGDDARKQAIDAAYGQATSRLDPQWDRRMEAGRTQLLNQGLDPSSEAYKNQMQDMNFARNDAYSSAMNGAISQGTEAGHTAFQDNLTAYNNPLQQEAIIKALAAVQSNPELLNAIIARGNHDMNQATVLQQGNADTMSALSPLLGYLGRNLQYR